MKRIFWKYLDAGAEGGTGGGGTDSKEIKTSADLL
jgi:hypothetical protein